MVRSTVDLTKLLNESSSVQLVSHVEADVPSKVSIDAHVQRLLMNLLTNAIYHTIAGTIRVEVSTGIGSARPTDEESSHLIDVGSMDGGGGGLSEAAGSTYSDGLGALVLQQQQAWLQIRVSDSGCGVQDKKACFEPFVSGRASVGLGLYLVRQHCEALGGSCGVDDTALAKSGASFWFRVPIDNGGTNHGTNSVNVLHSK